MNDYSVTDPTAATVLILVEMIVIFVIHIIWISRFYSVFMYSCCN